jgi:hypothetical protein
MGQVVTVAALSAIGLLWLRLLFVQPPAGDAYDRRDPTQTRVARHKMDEVSVEASRLAAAARRGESRSTVLLLSAEEINALLATQPEVRGVLDDARISEPEVRLQHGRVITSATVIAGGTPVRLTAEGTLAARGGMLIYASDTVRVAGVPAPARVRAAVETRIAEAFHRVEQQAHARVDRVIVDRDRIKLYLSSEPGVGEDGLEPRESEGAPTSRPDPPRRQGL